MITRTDSTFDINTRQIDIIAEVQDPFGNISGQPALKIGQFVSARIQGRTIENVFVIPNKSIREGSYVYVVRDGKLAKQTINIQWQDDQNALIASGITNGEQVVTTSLNSTLAGASAKLSDAATPSAQASETDANNRTQSGSLSNNQTDIDESAGQQTAKQNSETSKTAAPE